MPCVCVCVPFIIQNVMHDLFQTTAHSRGSWSSWMPQPPQPPPRPTHSLCSSSLLEARFLRLLHLLFIIVLGLLEVRFLRLIHLLFILVLGLLEGRLLHMFHLLFHLLDQKPIIWCPRSRVHPFTSRVATPNLCVLLDVDVLDIAPDIHTGPFAGLVPWRCCSPLPWLRCCCLLGGLHCLHGLHGFWHCEEGDRSLATV